MAIAFLLDGPNDTHKLHEKKKKEKENKIKDINEQ